MVVREELTLMLEDLVQCVLRVEDFPDINVLRPSPLAHNASRYMYGTCP